MPTLTSPDLLSASSDTPVATEIADRLSEEIIIALVGPVSSGVSTAASLMSGILTQRFAYKVCPIIKPSDFIKEEASRVGINTPPSEPIDEYINQMQSAGNKLRERFGGKYLAEKAVERIVKFRKENGGYNDRGVVLPGRRAYIIDSLKNEDELKLLREIYGETLCVFGIFAPDAIRKKRLADMGVSADRVKNILDRDQNEILSFGQKTRKLFVQSDFFVCNDRKQDELAVKIQRYLDLIFATVLHTPTRAEAAMYKASSASTNSACMSRQVGASIVSQGGELIAVGWNDVPRFGGGLYSEDDQFVWDAKREAIEDRDHRCFKWRNKACHNEERRRSIVDKVAKKLVDGGALKRGFGVPEIKKLLSGSDIDALIEFSRSIHAEMEAILSVAREGKHSLVGATLYTNTYPCHNCARHIVASGITAVVYIEPYAKSLATDLHADAVTEDPEERGKVVFRQFDGVAPQAYDKIFRQKLERKRDGKLTRPDPRAAVPVFRVRLDSQSMYESKVLVDLERKEESGSSSMD